MKPLLWREFLRGFSAIRSQKAKKDCANQSDAGLWHGTHRDAGKEEKKILVGDLGKGLDAISRVDGVTRC